MWIQKNYLCIFEKITCNLHSNSGNQLVNAELLLNSNTKPCIKKQHNYCWITLADEFYKLQPNKREIAAWHGSVTREQPWEQLSLERKFTVKAVLFWGFTFPIKQNPRRILACVWCLQAGECRTWAFATNQVLKLTKKICLQNEKL